MSDRKGGRSQLGDQTGSSGLCCRDKDGSRSDTSAAISSLGVRFTGLNYKGLKRKHLEQVFCPQGLKARPQ